MSEDLPVELQEQLRGGNHSGRESVIQKATLEVLEAYDEPLDLNQILVAVYRATGKVLKRESVRQALYRLTETGQVNRFARGVYEIASEDSQADAAEAAA